MISLAMKFHEEQYLAQILERKPKKITQLSSQGIQALEILQQTLAAFPSWYTVRFHIPNLYASTVKNGLHSITQVGNLTGESVERTSQEKRSQGTKCLIIPFKTFQSGINVSPQVANEYCQTFMSNFQMCCSPIAPILKVSSENLRK